MPPTELVRDAEGMPIWRVRVASTNEMTCRICGEVTTGAYCERCGYDESEAVETPMVRTIDYLRPGEYEIR